MKWKCHIPGKANTDWDGGYFPLTMEFSEDYPAKPPKVGLCLCCNALSLASCHVMSCAGSLSCSKAVMQTLYQFR